MEQQLPFFDEVPQKSKSFLIFHDESGTDLSHERFQLHGALFIPTDKFNDTYDKLSSFRGGCKGRLHFKNLRDKHSREKSTVVKKWLDCFYDELANYCFYKCLILDTHSSFFDREKLKHPHYVYNHTAMLAVFSGITWFFNRFDEISIMMFSEDVSRSRDDNFCDYLPSTVVKKANQRHKPPKVSFNNEKIILVSGDPKTVENEYCKQCELIQLTDILTSSVHQAIVAGAQQEIKLEIGKLVADWITDTRLPPWAQSKDLHRKFSISSYPSRNGSFYDVPLSIVTKEQLSFDEFSETIIG